MPLLPRRRAVAVFLAFAFAYFFSALVRAITATLSPTLVDEFSLSARDLGLLAGGYFLGFSLTQLPLGTWLDRHGPRRVIVQTCTLDHPAALPLYQKLGFSPVGQKKEHVRPMTEEQRARSVMRG